MCPSTACTAGLHAIIEGYLLMQANICDIMITGGVDAVITPWGMAGFSRLKALTNKFNDNPELGSRPFDSNRSGFVMSEGAGCLILEDYEHAKARNAKIYAEIVGFGLSADAYHMTSPQSNGKSIAQCMNNAVNMANYNTQSVLFRCLFACFVLSVKMIVALIVFLSNILFFSKFCVFFLENFCTVYWVVSVLFICAVLFFYVS